MSKTKQEEAIEKLETCAYWFKGGNTEEKYRVIFNSKQWVILRNVKSLKELTYRLDNEAPTHFLSAFEPES